MYFLFYFGKYFPIIINLINNSIFNFCIIILIQNNKKKRRIGRRRILKKSDSWGFFHTIEIACILFNISIFIYIDNGIMNIIDIVIHKT